MPIAPLYQTCDADRSPFPAIPIAPNLKSDADRSPTKHAMPIAPPFPAMSIASEHMHTLVSGHRVIALVLFRADTNCIPLPFLLQLLSCIAARVGRAWARVRVRVFAAGATRAMVMIYRAWCPFGKYCSSGNKQLCKFPTRAQVINKVECHLRYSPFHRRLGNKRIADALLLLNVEENDEDIEEPIDDGEEPTDEAEGADLAEAEDRGADGVGDASGTPERTADIADLRTNMEIMQTQMSTLVRAINKRPAQAMTPTQPPGPPPLRADPVVGPSSVLSIRPRPQSAATIEISAESINAVIDAFNRAEQALRHSALMSNTAAQAFTSEANVLNNTRTQIEGIFRNRFN